MYSIQRRCTHQFDSLIVRQTFGYIVTDTLNIDQCCVSFVAMINIFLNTQLLQCQDATDTEQNFLFQTVFPVTAIKLVSDRTVEFTIHFIVRIQQIERDTSYIHTPYKRMNEIIQIRNIHNHLITILIHHALDRQLTEVLSFVVGNLLTIHRESLCKVTVTIQKTDCAKVYIAIRSLFQVVAGKNAQTT